MVLPSSSAFCFSGKVSNLLHEIKIKNNNNKKILWQSDSPEQSSRPSGPNFFEEDWGQVYVTAVAENKLLCQEAVCLVSSFVVKLSSLKGQK